MAVTGSLLSCWCGTCSGRPTITTDVYCTDCDAVVDNSSSERYDTATLTLGTSRSVGFYNSAWLALAFNSASGNPVQNIDACRSACVCQTPALAASQTGRYFAVALQIEDFYSSSSTTPMSSIPIQFLFYVVAAPTSCSVRLVIIGVRPNRACVGQSINLTVSESAVAQPGCTTAASKTVHRPSLNGTNIYFNDAATNSVVVQYDAGWSSNIPYSGPESIKITDALFWHFEIWNPELSSTTSITTTAPTTHTATSRSASALTVSTLLTTTGIQVTTTTTTSTVTTSTTTTTTTSISTEISVFTSKNFEYIWRYPVAVFNAIGYLAMLLAHIASMSAFYT
ncbi:unnamed protein product [Rotaria socialis]|uniref:Uncharacterized protein n=1 Tax=Rotaria socialis TaxID=392032 RepID=A0A818HTT5_9BILA|nr:unnamed protein product [Rotaria socialis]